MESIRYNIGPDNLGGIASLYYLPIEDLLLIPKRTPEGITANILLKEGKSWKQFSTSKETLSFKETESFNRSGRLYRQELKGYIAKDSPEIQKLLLPLKGRKFILLYVDHNNSYPKLVGSKQYYLSFETDLDTKAAASGGTGRNFSFRGESSLEAIFYKDSFQVDETVIQPGPDPETPPEEVPTSSQVIYYPADSNNETGFFKGLLFEGWTLLKPALDRIVAVVKKKADLGEDGKVLANQLPAIATTADLLDYSPEDSNNDTGFFAGLLTEAKLKANIALNRIVSVIKKKADLGEDGKVLASQLPDIAEAAIVNFSAYDPLEVYTAGAGVTYNSRFWQAKTDLSAGQAPPSDTTTENLYWQELSKTHLQNTDTQLKTTTGAAISADAISGLDIVIPLGKYDDNFLGEITIGTTKFWQAISILGRKLKNIAAESLSYTSAAQTGSVIDFTKQFQTRSLTSTGEQLSFTYSNIKLGRKVRLSVISSNSTDSLAFTGSVIYTGFVFMPGTVTAPITNIVEITCLDNTYSFEVFINPIV